MRDDSKDVEVKYWFEQAETQMINAFRVIVVHSMSYVFDEINHSLDIQCRHDKQLNAVSRIINDSISKNLLSKSVSINYAILTL